MRKKCYIYTRVSTAAQTEGYSLEAQTERLRKYADYKEMEVVREEYYRQTGVSADAAGRV